MDQGGWGGWGVHNASLMGIGLITIGRQVMAIANCTTAKFVKFIKMAVKCTTIT